MTATIGVPILALAIPMGPNRAGNTTQPPTSTRWEAGNITRGALVFRQNTTKTNKKQQKTKNKNT